VDLHKVYVNVSEEQDDSDIRQKQAKQRIENLDKEHKLTDERKDELLKNLKETEQRRKAGQ
jgi:septal ring factor EnvC (AmiA/AmiB activator)